MTQPMKRTLSLILAILLSLSLFPGLAFADEEPAADADGVPQTVEIPEGPEELPEEPKSPAQEDPAPAGEPEALPEPEELPEEVAELPEEVLTATEVLTEEVEATTAAAATVETPVPVDRTEAESSTEAGAAAPASEDATLPEAPAAENAADPQAPEESAAPEVTPPVETPAPAASKYALKTPTVKSVSNTEAGIKITWGSVKGAAKYRVFRRVEGGKWKKVGDTTGTSLTDKKAEAGVTYTYTVRCLSSNGKKYTSDYVAGPTITRLTAVKLSKAACASGGVKVTWKKLAGAEGYYVYRKTSGSSWKKVGTVKSGATLNYTDTTAKSGTTYTYTVRAYANGYKGLYNKTGVSVKYVAAPVISSLSNVEGGVKLSWGSVEGAGNYRVFRRVGKGKWQRLGNTTSTSFTDATAQAGVDYTYTVRCLSANGKKYISGYLPGENFRYFPAPALSGLTAVDGGMEFQWAAADGAEEYIVYRKASGGSWTQIATVGGDVTSYIDEAAPEGTVCAYTVRAVRQGQKSGYVKDGILPTGWIEFGGKTYKIKADGTKTTGWVKKDGHKYYFKSDGTMATGWQTINDNRYYFFKQDDENGGPRGAMATSTEIGDWVIKSNGKAVTKTKVAMTKKAQSYYSSTSWLILVDTKNCVTGVFKGSQGNWTLKYYWDCAPGTSSTPTVLGTFTVQEKGYYFNSGSARCFYYTQFYGNYLFHSTLYYHDGTPMDSRVGQRLSHGCVRLEISNAKWIYNNIPRGTKVVTYY